VSKAARLVVFDCDGTLADSQHLIVSAMQRAFSSEGLTAPSPTAVRGLVGLSLPDFISQLDPELDDGAVGHVLAAYRSAFRELRQQDGQRDVLYPGLRDLLFELHARGCLLGVATGKSRRGLVSLLEEHKLLELFSTLQTADGNPSKPHPGMLLRALQETGIEARDAVLVGDTTYDMEMAILANVRAIGVGWGYHPVEELRRAGAFAVVHDSPELRGRLLFS
jgi:phosphoglycolate phosphatase